MKLLVDMNLSPQWTAFLNNEGIQAVHWSSLGDAGASDSEIMRLAAEQDYVVLDFSAILAVTKGYKPSVVQLRMEDLSIAVAGPKVGSAIVRLQSELEKGALVTINDQRTRVRLLPIFVSEKNP